VGGFFVCHGPSNRRPKSAISRAGRYCLSHESNAALRLVLRPCRNKMTSKRSQFIFDVPSALLPTSSCSVRRYLVNHKRNAWPAPPFLLSPPSRDPSAQPWSESRMLTFRMRRRASPLNPRIHGLLIYDNSYGSWERVLRQNHDRPIRQYLEEHRHRSRLYCFGVLSSRGGRG
jgi:hypothetical protein